MANKTAQARTEVEIMLGVWEWWKETELTAEVVIRCEVERTERKGVMRIVWYIALENALLPEEACARYVVEWPSSRNQTLAGCFLAGMVQAEQLASDLYQDMHKPLAYPR